MINERIKTLIMQEREKNNMVKRERAYGGCLGAARRRRP